MAEAVGLTASVIAIVQLTGRLIALGYEYIGGVKSASKDMRDLVDELQSLGKVLAILKDHVQADQNLKNTALQSLNGQNGPIQGCSLELKRLQAKLEPNTGWWKRKLSTLKWPLKEKETSRYIIRIERQKNLFNFALITDQLTLSKEIKVYVQNTEDIARKLQTESAALSKELEAYTRSTTLAFQRIETDIQDLQVQSLEIQNWSQKEGIRSTEKERKELLSWLYPESFEKKHIEISSRRKENTGGWILKEPEFESWSKGLSGSRLILGHGIPGSGKTFISSLVIDHFRRLRAQAPNSGYGVAYIYFDYKEREQQTPPNIVASLLKKLIGQTELIPTEVRSLYHKLGKSGERPTFSGLVAALLAALPSFAQVFLIFDALDECHRGNQRNEILKLLCRLGDAGANLFLTSRPHQQDIQSSLNSALKFEILAKNGDIMAYIEQKIDENERAKSLITRGRFKERIISGLVDCAQGMFLMVHFHIEHLCQQTTVRQVLTELERLKRFSTEERPLDPTYDIAMEKIRSQPKSCAELALKALSWLVKAKRPLKVNELLEAVSVRPNVYKLEEWDLPEKETLLDVCASLVIIHGDIVRLAHYTVQEYLLTKIITGDVHLSLAITCITYISFDVFPGGDNIFHLIKTNPFLSYAARYLGSHLEEACDETPTTEPILYLLTSPGNSALYQALITSYKTTSPNELHLDYFYEGSKHFCRPTNYDKSVPTLHLATFIGNYKVVRLLLEGANASIPDSDGWRMVCLARDKGHHAVVQMLLENNIISTLSAGSKGTALHIAVLRRCILLVQLLIEKGADTSAKDNSGCTPLYYAVKEDMEDIIRVLLDNGADVTALDLMGNTPLHNAVERGKEKIIRFLVDNGAYISAANSDWNTPLHNAVRNGSKEEIIRFLLDNCADVFAVNRMGNTPLHNAVEIGREKIIRVLLDYGADVSTANSEGNTPLHDAVYMGREKIIRVLLDHGADVTATNLTGDTPLYRAIKRRMEEIVRIALRNGADIFTTLLTAISMDDVETLELLLEKARSNSYNSKRNAYGRTALHIALLKGTEFSTLMVKLLLKNNLDVSIKDLDGMTALHLAVSRGYEEKVLLLIENGSDTSTKDLSGEPVLQMAVMVSRDKETVIRMLLENQADISAKDSLGKTALHLAVSLGYGRVTRLLLENGASISEACFVGMTALHIAASCGNGEITKLLLENGADISPRNKIGWTPFQIATYRGHNEVAQLLLDKDTNCAAQSGPMGIIPPLPLRSQIPAKSRYPHEIEYPRAKRQKRQ